MKSLRIICGLLAGTLFFAGCGQKKEQPPFPEPSQAVTAPGELPELEQNKMFITNRPEPVLAPDVSFTPVPDGQQPRPPDAEETPALD